MIAKSPGQTAPCRAAAGNMSDDRRSAPDTTDVRDAKGRFAPGNPGRQRDARNRVTRAAEALLGRDAAALTQKAIALAKDGAVTALRLCLERLIPPARERPLDIDKLSDDPAAVPWPDFTPPLT
jgi:hypothetical protein